MEDLYITLNIKKSITQDRIKIAFRVLAFKYHPDKNQGDKEATEKFIEVAYAYKILGDPDKRRYYDRFGLTGDEQEDKLEDVLRKFNADFKTDNIEKHKEENIQKAGKKEGERRQCWVCRGSGIVTRERGFLIVQEKCKVCKDGFIEIEPEPLPPIYEMKHGVWYKTQ